ncbi:MAG TPA: hypothetical protein ENN67_06120 [Firmicutes bacterium]|nr:hypothetical protein [Bacillota bacterium]
MIGGIGGTKTQNDWYLRCVWSPKRIETIRTGLDFYYAANSSFPSSFTELSDKGYFPLRPLDPITAEPIEYAVYPETSDDFDHLSIDSSTDEWRITGQSPDLTGSWFQFTWEIPAPQDFWAKLSNNRSKWYPNDVAMRGAMLGEVFRMLLMDYQMRRARLPESSDDLLDGLWIVNDEWAKDNPDLNLFEPGVFVFGLFEDSPKAFAWWTDLSGQVYSETWKYNPWRTSGWLSPPQPEDYEGATNYPDGPLPDDFVPNNDNIIWSCFLPG